MKASGLISSSGNSSRISVSDSPGMSKSPLIASDRDGISLTLRIVEDEEGFLTLRDAWDSLAMRSHSAVFQTFDWQYLWWKHYKSDPDLSLRILVFLQEQTVVGILPLFLERVKACGIQVGRRLRMLGCGVSTDGYPVLFSSFGVSDYLGLMALPGYQDDVIAALTGWMGKNLTSSDECYLEHMPVSNEFTDRLVPGLEKTGCTCIVESADLCPGISVPASMENYKKTLKPQVRRQISQVQKALGELYEIVPVNTPEDLDAALQHLIDMHQRRWNELGYPGLFSDRRFEEFQKELIPKFNLQKRLWCKIVRAGDACIAVRIGYLFNNTLYDYLSGFEIHSPEARRRPGNALLLSMIEDAMALGVDKVDLLRGDEAYKKDFADQESSNIHLRIIFPRKRGVIQSAVFAILISISRVLALIQKEFVLMSIQIRVHGIFSGLFAFLRFRSGRLLGALSRSSRRTTA